MAVHDCLPCSTPVNALTSNTTVTDVTPGTIGARTLVNLGLDTVTADLDGGLGEEIVPDSSFGAPVPEIVETSLDPQSPHAVNLCDLRKYESRFDQGYDSDGNPGPWCDMVKEEGPQFFEEDFIFDPNLTNLHGDDPSPSIVTNSTEPTEPSLPPSSPPPPKTHVPIDEALMKGMKNPELKAELQARGEPVSGSKSVLLRRLFKALENRIPVRFSKKSNSKFASRKSDCVSKAAEKKKDSGLRFFQVMHIGRRFIL